MYKITKGMARKLYNEGAEIMILPDRVRPDRARTTGTLAEWILKPADNSVSFEQVCNVIHYYNCSPKTGMTLVFYAKQI